MQITKTGNLNFKDRYSNKRFNKDLGEKAPVRTSSDHLFYDDKNAQLHRMYILAQIAPKLPPSSQYCIDYDVSDSDKLFEIKEADNSGFNIERTCAIGYKNGSLETHTGWYGVVDQQLIKNDDGIVLKWKFANWAGVKSATFYPTGELNSINFGPSSQYIPSREMLPTCEECIKKQGNKPDTIRFYKNGNVSQEIYTNKFFDRKGTNVGTITVIKHFDKYTQELTLVQTQTQKPFAYKGEYRYSLDDLSDSIIRQYECPVKPFDWRANIPDELQEIIDENKRLAQN